MDHLDVSNVSNLLTTLISCLALVVAVWSAIVSAKHNRIAMRPQLRVDYRQSLDGTVKVALSNRGVGPATIDEFLAFIDSARLPKLDAMRLGEALHALGLPERFYVYVPASGDVLAAGEEVVLLDLPPPGQGAHHRAVANALVRLSFEVRFRSLYGERGAMRRTGTGQLASASEAQALKHRVRRVALDAQRQPAGE